MLGAALHCILRVCAGTSTRRSELSRKGQKAWLPYSFGPRKCTGRSSLFSTTMRAVSTSSYSMEHPTDPRELAAIELPS